MMKEFNKNNMKTLQELKQTGFRIRIEGESKERKDAIQEKLFSLGWGWEYSGKSVRNVTRNYINCYKDGSMLMGVDVNDGLPELTIAELFTLQTEPKRPEPEFPYNLKRGDRILVWDDVTPPESRIFLAYIESDLSDDELKGMGLKRI